MQRINCAVIKLLWMLFLIARMLAPDTASACSGCTFAMCEEIFPFITLWIMLFLTWSVIFIIWHIASPKRKELYPKAGRIIIELVVLFFGIAFTGLSVLLFYWAFVVGRLLWLSWKKGSYDLSPGVRKFSLVFNGITSAVLVFSAAASYAGYDVNRIFPGSPPVSYRTRGYDATAHSEIRNARTILEAEFQDQLRYPTLEKFNEHLQPVKGVVLSVKKLTEKEYAITSEHEKGSKQFAITSDKPCVLRKERSEPDEKFICME